MILKNCRLIPELSSGIGAEHAEIWISEGKIRKVEPHPRKSGELFPQEAGAEPFLRKSGVELLSREAGAGLPECEEVFDCGGKTLLPGLFDLHTHISGIRGFQAGDTKTPMKILVESAAQASAFLDYGFTTIRDCGSVLRAANFVREMIERGTVKGPHLIACGAILTPTEVEESDGIWEMYVNADGANEMRKAVRKEMAEHADFIKIMASGAAFHPAGIPKQPILTREELQSAVEAARLKDTYVAAHAHSDAAIRLCAEEGVRTIEHATYLSEETMELLKERECWLVPTLAAMHVSNASPDPNEFWNVRLGRMLKECAGNIERAYKSGLKLGFGTDSTVGMEQYDQGIEFWFRKEFCHMKNVDILLQATKYSAEIAGMADRTGEIREGLLADLILVDGNPDETIEVMYQKPEHVWKEGERIK
ncbi:MAG: amidohydrolase family protein [Eubacteriales bacterium]|nr:amidohydrolase family protein [Eubacteriales bacterium]